MTRRRLICRRRLAARRIVMIWFAMAGLFTLPIAAPFASAGSQTTTANNHFARKASVPSTTTIRPMTSSEVTTMSDNNKRGFSAIRRLVPGSGRNKGRKVPNESSPRTWKGGESKASTLSRLFFHYASPVLQTASIRRLDPTDSFDIPPEEQMNQSVGRVKRIYEHIKQQNLQSKTSVLKQDSESWLLTRTLLSHQRNMLVLTGCLRLLNTAIQAFPAILIARVLRLIEAGTENPPRKAMTAALTLVGVLTLKMVVENQYFHNVVKLSTQVRGSLAGLIFDKSLRLPSGTSTSVRSSNNSNSTDTARSGAGSVLNLMQSDASIIEGAAMQLHTLWDAPLQIAIYTSLLYRYLGKSVFWGIAVLLVTIPVNSVALRILNRLSKFENEAKDARTKRTAESISHMQLLKLQGWEQHFADDIRKHRGEELRRHLARGMVRAVNSAISNAVPSLVLVVTLTAYVKSGNPVVASTIFTAISLFNQLRFPLFFFPHLMDSLANGKNAMKRISDYLAAEEISPYVQRLPSAGGGSIQMKNGNFLWPATLSGKASAALSDINLSVKPGEIVAVVGTVGSGKSALVRGLLGELDPVPGMVVRQAVSRSSESMTTAESAGEILERPSVVAEGNVAYCSQEAWLPKGTIKEAILFGREYDEERYRAAIRDAGLDNDIVDDISSRTDGTNGLLTHDTDTGEGGLSLSGGQRARVALARALYSGDDTKVFLLDDCLAALDASVGSIVFDRLTKRFRSTNSAVILVTNDPSIPRRCDRVILMGNVSNSTSCSTIIDEGPYSELLARGHKLQAMSISAAEKASHVDDNQWEGSHLLHAPKDTQATSSFAPKLAKISEHQIQIVHGESVLTNATQSCHADPECDAISANCPDFVNEQQGQVLFGRMPADETEEEEETVHVDFYRANDTTVDVAAPFKGSTPVSSKGPVGEKLSSVDDAMAAGAVPFSTYLAYFKSVRKPIIVFAMLSAYLLSNSAQFFQQYTVAKWTEVGGSAMAEALNHKYMRQLVQAAGIVSISLWLRSLLTTQVGIRASEHLHSKMLNSVFRAPMSFFDSTPSGQLLSRFGKEMQTVDSGVPDSISSVLYCFLQIFMSIGALAGVVSPIMLVPIVSVGSLYAKAMSLFRPASRDMKRAETKTRSPIYTHFGEALRGTETIRSVPGASLTWSKHHRSLTDANLGVFYTVKAMDRWLSTRLETLGNTVVLAAAVTSVLLTRADRLTSGNAAWGLTQSLAITGLLTWAVRCLTDMETNMMGVMRVRELAQLPTQPSVIQRYPGVNASLAPLSSTALIDSGWPWSGNIQFKKVSMRYNPASPLVLKDITITVPAGSTLGVVGRTGSGKSSLLLTLFRLAEIERDGSIEIDGVDIRSVELEKLRQAIAPIPQNPVLFAGSLAFTLDATGKASPAEMWEALEAASPSLAAQFRQGDGLDTEISEGGKNLSLGQRQLICLARALLRKSKLLVLDEATSSVDGNTDQQVQETIQREFVNKGATVITVAHRLDTVLGYDKICVLGDGCVLEYGSPSELLRNPDGELRRLVDADRRNKQKGLAKEAPVAG